MKDLAFGELLKIESSNGMGHLYTVVEIDVVDFRTGSLLLDMDVISEPQYIFLIAKMHTDTAARHE